MGPRATDRPSRKSRNLRRPPGYFACLVFFAFGPLFFAALFFAARFLAALFLLAVFGLADVDLGGVGAAFVAGAPADGVVFGAANAAAGSDGLDGAAFAGSLSRAACALWRASASAKRASRKARI